MNFYYGPLLECPDLHIVKAGITEYNISCDIISSPVIPESNISWEFPSRTQHSTLPERSEKNWSNFGFGLEAQDSEVF